MCNSREHIIERIKKLLALSDNNTNMQEAIAAALKAQKLIAQYDVTQSELNESEPDTIDYVESANATYVDWHAILANVVAANFRCAVYSTFKDRTVSDLSHMMFIGYTVDANAAAAVYNKLREVGEREAKATERDAEMFYGSTRGVYHSFTIGFCYGVLQELEKQAQALALTVPQAVKDEFALMNLTPETIETAIEPTILDYSQEGEVAGRDAVRATRLESAEPEYLLRG